MMVKLKNISNLFHILKFSLCFGIGVKKTVFDQIEKCVEAVGRVKLVEKKYVKKVEYDWELLGGRNESGLAVW